jgi:hypothetical protein
MTKLLRTRPPRIGCFWMKGKVVWIGKVYDSALRVLAVEEFAFF